MVPVSSQTNVNYPVTWWNYWPSFL